MKQIFYIIADAILLIFFLIEIFARDGKEAKKVAKTKFEKGSTDITAFTIIVSSLIVLISPLFDHLNFFQFTSRILVGIIGSVLAVTGVLLRIAGMLTLGRFYTRTLQKTENHKLIKNGIYKYLRHPGYAGTIFIFVGAGLTAGNVFSFVIVTILILITYLYRIKVEEKMLIKIFSEEYIIYKKHSKKIIPFIY